MAIKQFLHVSICISDPAKSVPFYRDVLGFKLLREGRYKGAGPSKVFALGDTDLTVWLMGRDSQRLELIYFGKPKSPARKAKPRANDLGLSHLTVGVDDIDGTVRELKAKGVKVREQSVASFSGKGARNFVFEDPDGNVIETYELRPDGKPPYDAPK